MGQLPVVSKENAKLVRSVEVLGFPIRWARKPRPYDWTHTSRKCQQNLEISNTTAYRKSCGSTGL